MVYSCISYVDLTEAFPSSVFATKKTEDANADNETNQPVIYTFVSIGVSSSG